MQDQVREVVQDLIAQAAAIGSSNGKKRSASEMLGGEGESDEQDNNALAPVLLGIMRLKGLNRQLSIELDEKRKLVEKRKEKVDSLHLKLENLLYKQSYLLQEIKSCKDLSTPHLQLLESELGGKALGATSFSSSLPLQHEAAMQALRDEMQQRKDERKALEGKSSEYKKVLSVMDEKRKFLEELPQKIGKLDSTVAEISKEFSHFDT